ncbi:uncharacterized protein DC041_0008593 [Schistosoma bovis]|uniref:Reverse transcriptase domain-containing protein n=1 Tax=Schistosoma bovis TaxID=6184 RepID=A0A430QQG8_SCHBO|nr:uncharacterized protein DC041_0008593 [Schistosoma bovis]
MGGAAFLQLKNIWNSKQLLLYGADTGRTTTTIIKKVHVLINSCLHKILDVQHTLWKSPNCIMRGRPKNTNNNWKQLDWNAQDRIKKGRARAQWNLFATGTVFSREGMQSLPDICPGGDTSPHTRNSTRDQVARTASANDSSTRNVTPGLLKPRSKLHVRAYNLGYLKSRAIDVCCVSETRIQDPSSVIHLTSPYQNKEPTRFTLCVSGSPDAASRGLAGVGIASSPRAKLALLDWIPVDSRLCAVRLNGTVRTRKDRDTCRCLFFQITLASVILRRLFKTRERLTRKEQACFRSEHRHTYQRPTIVVFLDIRAAFDSLDKTKSVSEKFINILKALYTKTSGRARAYNHLSIFQITLASVILRRLFKTRERLTRKEQACFRSEHRHTYQRPTIVVFLDIRAAFDSLDRTVLWDCLLKKGVPEKFINILKALYKNTSGRVRAYNHLSPLFHSSSGVRQGCPISPFLFNFAIDDILETALMNVSNGGVDLLPGERLLDLEYADDIVLLCDNAQGMQSALNQLAINGCNPVLTLDGEQIEVVDKFVYLGSCISAARAVYANLGHLWRLRRIYNASVRAVLFYACETWPLRVEGVRRLSVFDHRCLQRIADIQWQHHVSNAEIRHRRIPRRALFANAGTGWKKRRESCKELASVGPSRLLGWGPRDSATQWLEALSDMAHNRSQWRSCCNPLLSS